MLDGGHWRPAHGTTGGGYYKAPQEFIDARQEPVGWMEPGFKDHDADRRARGESRPRDSKAGRSGLVQSDAPDPPGRGEVSYARQGPAVLEITLPPNVTAELDLDGLRLPEQARINLEGDGYAGQSMGAHQLRSGKTTVTLARL